MVVQINQIEMSFMMKTPLKISRECWRDSWTPAMRIGMRVGSCPCNQTRNNQTDRLVDGKVYTDCNRMDFKFHSKLLQ